jgi:hypothetical protein
MIDGGSTAKKRNGLRPALATDKSKEWGEGSWLTVKRIDMDLFSLPAPQLAGGALASG